MFILLKISNFSQKFNKLTQKERSNKRHHGWEKDRRKDWKKPADKGWISQGKLRREGQICRSEEGEHNSDEEADNF
ncbi:MAG: hypothetical protein OCU16_05630 [Candidatus Methanospirare jalkutatii]|nr:hypothetical protein [Candidatus Methanoxibalbensis ujae]MCW7080558.1 hypothetical protein [Candidatus Methanospirare jalkutatii]